jgi:hypothetical protein
MTCADARHRLLTADLSTVRGETDAALRDHLSVCTPCAAMASTIVGGSLRLRNALVARRQVARPRKLAKRGITMTLIPVALAAEITLIALFARRDARQESLQSTLRDSVAALTQAPAAIMDTDLTVAAAARHTAVKSTREAVHARPAGVRRALSTAAMFDDDTAGLSQVRVRLNDRQHAAIISTSNPKITVVWLSKGDSL